MNDELREDLKKAIEVDDRDLVDSLLSSCGELQEALNEAMFKWGMPPLAAAKSVEMARLLERHGADVQSVGQWWAPGFGVRGVDPAVGRFLVDEGAPLTPHAAAALGLVDQLAGMLDADPLVVAAKGGDGCTPLHFARDAPTAKLLIDRSANLDARDDDHESTPAQWLIGDCPEVAGFLLDHGATPDIFLAAALGDRTLCEKLIAADRGCLAWRIGKAPFHPIGYQGRGGTILQWSLGFNAFAHQFAAAKGHDGLFRYLFDESDVTTRFLVACVMALRSEAEEIAAAHPQLVASLPEEDLELPARYCWETNANVEAVRLMLDVGFPIDHPETSHGYSPLHNAAWGGYGDLVELLIERGHPVDVRDPDYNGTPLGWAIHCCSEDGRHPEGEYARVVETLIEAGNPWDATVYPTGDERLDAIFETRLRNRLDGAIVLGDQAALEQMLANAPDDHALAVALNVAAFQGRVDECGLLLDAGANIAVPEGFCWTALHAAVAGGSLETAELLLSRGADVGAVNYRGGTAWHTVGDFGLPREMIDLLIRYGGGDIINNKSNYGYTALDLAIRVGHEATAEYLRECGAVTAKTDESK